MVADIFGKTTFVARQTADVAPLLHRFASITVFAAANGQADRLQLGPLVGLGKTGGRLELIVLAARSARVFVEHNDGFGYISHVFVASAHLA